jgi:hypothetical protein
VFSLVSCFLVGVDFGVFGTGKLRYLQGKDKTNYGFFFGKKGNISIEANPYFNARW